MRFFGRCNAFGNVKNIPGPDRITAVARRDDFETLLIAIY